MKRNAIARIIVYSVLALVLTGVMVGGIAANGFMFSFHEESGTVITGEKATFDVAQIKKIEIDWAAGAVSIKTADTDRISVSEVSPENSKYKMTYRLNDGTLSLDYSKGTIGIGFGNWNIPNKDLCITVPRDWLCDELEIDGAALEIDIEGLSVKSMNLDGASCNLQFSGKVDEVDIDGASADIKLNCENRISGIEVDGASCEIDVTLPQGCGFLVEMSGLSCSFHSDLSGVSQGDRYTYGDQHCKIQVDGLSCDVTIREANS